MGNLPIFIPLVFVVTTILGVFLFYNAANKSKITMAIIMLWSLLQAAISLTGFYTVTNTIPPRFALLGLPPLTLILALFTTAKGRRYLDSFDIHKLTIFHIIRVPVEMVLFWLFIYKKVPGLMTFEGRNFDILPGLTAPIMYYYGFRKKRINKTLLIAWNVICLALLFNIIAIAILSAPFNFQQFAFDQPNIAVLYFPFIWLPCCLVPMVLLAHLAAISRLIRGNNG